MADTESRIRKRKIKSASLQPCSTVRSELISDGEELSDKELDLTGQCGEVTPDQLEHGSGESDLVGIPLPSPGLPGHKGSVTFVLEKASLTLAYIGKRYQILSSDEHADYLRTKKLNPYDYRPDIVHEALLQIMDSRLRMAGHLGAVYIKTDGGVLIKVEPYAQIPRTLPSFCNMMAELLQKLSIKAKGKDRKLLRLVNNPVTKHLPLNSHKIGLSFSSEKAVQLREYVSGISSSHDMVFVVGAMAHGKIECDYIEDLVSVSHHHLSSGVCLRRICISLERMWSIL